MNALSRHRLRFARQWRAFETFPRATRTTALESADLAPLHRMTGIAHALAFSFLNLLHPRMLWLMLWPVLLALGAWLSVAFFLWGALAARLAALLKQWLETTVFFVRLDFGDSTLIAAHVFLYLVFIPLVYLTALLILGVFGMPAMVEQVARWQFPGLERRRGGSLAGSAWNGVMAMLGLAAMALASIPFWILPPLWPVIPVAIMGWVNQRVLRYDALAEHASADEMRALFALNRGALYFLGVQLALAAYVPVIGLFAPMLFGLAFIHFLLAELQAYREAPLEGRAVPL